MSLLTWPKQTNFAEPMPRLKLLFWIYFFLLIFEGALRKWIFPSLSAPLLLVRDPVGILIIWEAYRTGKWPQKWSAMIGALAAFILALCVLQLIATDNPWFAGIYGLRSYLLPFPVAFIMGENLSDEDLRRFGVVTLWIVLPLTLLEIAQYLSPSGSFLNRGAYEGAEQIAYEGERVRASATFSFVTGPAAFWPFAGAFVLYGFVKDKFAERWLLWASAFALLLSIPIIGSRTIVFEVAGLIACAGIAALCGVSQFVRQLRIAIPLLAVSFLVSLLPIFSEASSSLHRRFLAASSGEGTLTRTLEKRTFGSIFNTIEQADYLTNPIGQGMGRGAAAISRLMQGSMFPAGEGEIGRLMFELGSFPGLMFMLFRFALAAVVVVTAMARAREHEPLALLLVPLMLTSVTLDVLEQPTEQGFMVIALAFSLAALKHPKPLLAPTRLAYRPIPSLRNGSRRYPI
jgi:hypothetical protein